jgi:lipoprotein-anchoring transpeptidase ErfK/SrfK
MKCNSLLNTVIASSVLALSIPNAYAVAMPVVELTAEAVNNAALIDPVDAKANRAAILRAQILLDRAHFSTGEIDASFGGNMRRAIMAYQTANTLNASGSVDTETWAVLNKDNLPALSGYTITDADVAGPFVATPSSMLAKSKLAALGYTSSAEALGEKFHISPRLLLQLNPGKNFNNPGEEINTPNVLSPEPFPAAAKMVVDRSDASVMLLDAAGKTIARYPASSGSQYDPLPMGIWKINGVSANPVFHYNPKLFWDAKPKSAKATIPAGPNNPVGTVWIDLSKEHYGIHGTPEPSKIGKTESHGCIRLTNWNATELADAVSTGMSALLQE